MRVDWKGSVMLKVMVVFGTRPEAIKMCPLVLELQKREGITCVVCLTGQHREMLRQVMDVFGIREDYNLDIMKEGQSLSLITVNVMDGFDKVLRKETPDIVLVHGDTTTSFAAALSAFYLRIPVGHVEAGLRTYEMYSPFPEEFNRQAADLVSALYFAPTKAAKQNLLEEGKPENNIFVTGNTVIDALRYTVNDDYRDECLEWAKDSRMILLTAHRRENLGEPMEHIFRAVRTVAEENTDIKVIFPVHKNPEIRKLAEKYLAGEDRIRMIEPLDVMAFHNFMARSYLILTDSGGIQEEAPAMGIPVLVLRDVTERPEGVEAGTLQLVGTEERKIRQSVEYLLKDERRYQKMSQSVNPYGDGRASARIADILVKQTWRR